MSVLLEKLARVTTTDSATDPAGPFVADTFVCDACARICDAPPSGAGLFIWTRGDEIRYEEPPLCDECARAVTTTAMALWSRQDEEG